uniref:Uncharacterized protein n=1 Tax=Pristionchus pacificus TaxID=54126 RepID=A0A2A6CXQ7_PRIPA|eukprot:PDM82949.1 hypothetical protein PRIPAC_37342 [Pristionchus pacificus]
MKASLIARIVECVIWRSAYDNVIRDEGSLKGCAFKEILVYGRLLRKMRNRPNFDYRQRFKFHSILGWNAQSENRISKTPNTCRLDKESTERTPSVFSALAEVMRKNVKDDFKKNECHDAEST